jgi:5-methylcytosine-specific restriction endonuclease McrA
MECRVTRPVIRYKDLSFELCDICGSQVPHGRASHGITTCNPKCNAKKWDVKNGLIIKQEKEASGIRPRMFWQTISHECFKRDRYSCRNCNSGEKIECHHIIPISKGGNNQLDNLITLCSKCHKIEHSHARNVARKHRPLLTE